MFKDLPKFIQQQIIAHLEADNFKAAKELRDRWLAQKQAANTTTPVLFKSTSKTKSHPIITEG